MSFNKLKNPIFYIKKSRRPLSKKQNKLININLKKYIFKNFIKKFDKIFLEIGFGYGENLINLAKKNKKTLILGCEIYKPAIASVVEKIDEENLKNIQIFPKNIFDFFIKIKKNSINKIFLLFPDPWPKRKHHKRRLVNKALLKNFSKILIANGEIYIATDSDKYLETIINNFLEDKGFLWVNSKPKNCYIQPKNINSTKYQKKADIKSNQKYYLKFKKKS